MSVYSHKVLFIMLFTLLFALLFALIFTCVTYVVVELTLLITQCYLPYIMSVSSSSCCLIRATSICSSSACMMLFLRFFLSDLASQSSKHLSFVLFLFCFFLFFLFSWPGMFLLCSHTRYASISLASLYLNQLRLKGLFGISHSSTHSVTT